MFSRPVVPIKKSASLASSASLSIFGTDGSFMKLYGGPSLTQSSKFVISRNKKNENAPEISHLRIKRPKLNQDELDPFLDNNRRVKRSKCPTCLRSIFSYFKNCLKHEEGDELLDDLDPVAPRTCHSMHFINKLADSKSSKTLIKSDASFKNFFKAAFDGLLCLDKANELFKELILLLTFTHYSDEPLRQADKILIKGKTVLGSYAWISTFILQQLQFDAEVETTGYSSMELKEVIKILEHVVSQTLYIWQATVHTIETVENTHKHVEELFNNLIDRFGSQNEEGIAAATRHIKVYRKYESKGELEELKTYDAYKSAQTWARDNAAPLRIIYKDEGSTGVGSKEKITWLGFDVLSMQKKFSYIKIIQHDMEEICTRVLSFLEQIDKLLHSNSKGVVKKEEEKVLCFEEGVNRMGECLSESNPHSWNKEQIHNFLEVDKIALDSLDLLTLSTATMRTLAHEARHILHVTYETVRDLDYLECKVMNTYEEVAGACKWDYKGWDIYSYLDSKSSNTPEGKRNSNSSKKSRSSGGGGGSGHAFNSNKRKNKISKFDIEEKNLEKEDAEYRFERSLYQDILKDLPISCIQGSIQFALQDAESVFTHSSHEILAFNNTS